MSAEDLIYDSAVRAFWVLILATLPALAPALLIGLVVGLVQAATSIQEQTLSFVPKLVGVFLVLMMFGGITGGLLVDFTREIADIIPQMAR